VPQCEALIEANVIPIVLTLDADIQREIRRHLVVAHRAPEDVEKVGEISPFPVFTEHFHYSLVAALYSGSK